MLIGSPSFSASDLELEGVQVVGSLALNTTQCVHDDQIFLQVQWGIEACHI